MHILTKATISIATSFLLLSSGNVLAGENSVVLTHDQGIYKGGKLIFTASKGDTLSIVKTQPCRSDETKECWFVKTKKGKGFVRKEWVESEKNGHPKE